MGLMSFDGFDGIDGFGELESMAGFDGFDLTLSIALMCWIRLNVFSMGGNFRACHGPKVRARSI